MNRLLIVLGLMTVAAGFEYVPCGYPPVCQCNSPDQWLIHCTEESTIFPVFPDTITNSTTAIVLERSRISQLLPFEPEQWPSLHTVTFLDMPQVTVDTLTSLHELGFIVTVVWDRTSPSDACREQRPTTVPAVCPRAKPDVGCAVANLIMAVICLISMSLVGMLFKSPLVR